MKIGYERVSTAGQSTDTQRHDLTEAGIVPENIYTDKLSGKNTKRPELRACLRAVQDGDILVVTRLSRLCRSLHDLLDIIKGLEAKGVTLEVLHQPEVSTNTPTGRLVRNILASVDEFQREIIVENTREGLAEARRQGRKGGRKPELDQHKVRAVHQMRSEGVTITEIASTMRVSRATVYRHLNAAEPGAKGAG